jgi:N-acetylmuramoyl-L-alanine amidase
VIRQGDFLFNLANTFGFDADTVWQDPSNASLRALRPDPNILFPGDLLYIPDPPLSGPPMKGLTPGSTNNFVAPDPPTITLTVTFSSADATTYASKGYTIQELDQLAGLTTDENGVATFQVPVTLKTATVVFTDTGETYTLSIGGLDPINTLSGIFMRLQNLGYIGSDIEFEPSDLDTLRAGLRLLKASQSGSSDSAPASNPSPDSVPASTSAPPSAPASAAPAAPPPASSPSPDSAPASSPSPDSAPASNQDRAVDNAGLADDGTLDADTSNLLLKAYGC